MENNQQNLQPTAGNQEMQSTMTPEKPKKNNWIWVLLIVIIALGGGGYGIHWWMNSQDEDRIYATLEGNYEATDYEDFLKMFPDGKYADEVRQRLEDIQKMDAEWTSLTSEDTRRGYLNFKDKYSDCEKYVHLCDIKIDSLDWVDAQKAGTEEAINRYIEMHPEGRFLSEASIAQGSIKDAKVDETESMSIAETIEGFLKAFGDNNEEGICSRITPTMSLFLSKKNATKADVVKTINNMFNEHITKCVLNSNMDYEITKVPGASGVTYKVKFSVDQHITRDNAGKTFGSYTATAELNSNFRLTALTMTEVSKN